MSDIIDRLRRDAEMEESEAAVEGRGGEVVLDDQLLSEFFATRPDGWFDAALEALATHGERDEAPRAELAPLPSLPIARQRSVLDAFGAPLHLVRSALVALVGLSIDAADLLLERPASALLNYPAPRVGQVALACGQAWGRMFATIAESVRAADPYVYAYRPGSASAVPARSVSDSAADAEALLTWGRALFASDEG